MILRSLAFRPCGPGYVINTGRVVHGNGNGLGIRQPTLFQELNVGGIAIVDRKSRPALAGNKGRVRVYGNVGYFMLVQHGANEMAHAPEACHDNAGLIIFGGCFKRFR